MTDPSLIPAPPPKPDEPGIVEDLVDIFVSPSKVFERRRLSGGGIAFLVIAIVLSVVTYTGKNVYEPIMDAQFARAQAQAMQSNPNMTAEQIESMRNVGRTIGQFSLIVGVPLAMFFLGVFVWVVGKVFGAQLTFGASIMVASFAYVPRIVAGVIVDIQGLVMTDVSQLKNMAQLSLGPARFLDPESTSQVLLVALTRVDLATIWVTALVAIGYMAAGKLSREKAIAAAVVLWVLGAVFPIWGALNAG